MHKKRINQITIVPLLVTSFTFSSVLAQTTKNPKMALPAAGSIGTQAGDNNWTIATVDQNEVLKLIVSLQKEQKDIVMATVADISSAMNSFVAEQIMGSNGLQKLADDSVNNFVPLVNYQAAVRSYEAAEIALTAKITNLTNVPAMLNGTGEVESGAKGAKTGKQNLSYKTINLTPVAVFFNNQLASLSERVSKLTIKVGIEDQDIRVVKGITHEFAALIDVKYIEEQTRKAQELLAKGDSPKIRKAIDQVAYFIKDHINKMTKAFGTSQSRRFDLNDAGLKRAMSDLEEMFFMRSFLRKYYGTGIGALGVNYDKATFHIDMITTSNTIDWKSDVLRDRPVLTEVQDNIFYALATATSRSQDVLKKDVNLLSRLASMATLVLGQSSLAAVNTFVLGLLAADINEELTITGPGDGYADFKALYRNRYYKNPEDPKEKARIKELERSYLGMGSNKLTAANLAVSSSTPRGVFNIAKRSGVDVAAAALEQGRRMMESIDTLQSENAVLNDAKTRALED